MTTYHGGNEYFVMYLTTALKPRTGLVIYKNHGIMFTQK